MTRARCATLTAVDNCPSGKDFFESLRDQHTEYARGHVIKCD